MRDRARMMVEVRVTVRVTVREPFGPVAHRVLVAGRIVLALTDLHGLDHAWERSRCTSEMRTRMKMKMGMKQCDESPFASVFKKL